MRWTYRKGEVPLGELEFAIAVWVSSASASQILLSRLLAILFLGIKDCRLSLDIRHTCPRRTC